MWKSNLKIPIFTLTYAPLLTCWVQFYFYYCYCYCCFCYSIVLYIQIKNIEAFVLFNTFWWVWQKTFYRQNIRTKTDDAFERLPIPISGQFFKIKRQGASIFDRGFATCCVHGLQLYKNHVSNTMILMVLPTSFNMMNTSVIAGIGYKKKTEKA